MLDTLFGTLRKDRVIDYLGEVVIYCAVGVISVITIEKWSMFPLVANIFNAIGLVIMSYIAWSLFARRVRILEDGPTDKQKSQSCGKPLPIVKTKYTDECNDKTAKQ